MIGLGRKSLGFAAIGSRALSKICLGARVLWEAVSNCIAGGWWQHGHGWLYGTGWNQLNKTK